MKRHDFCFAGRLVGSLLAFCLVGVVGCGGSSSTDDSVVSPPGPSDVESSLPEEAEPPGAIELPDGVDPPQASEGATSESPSLDGGIEMPADAQAPVDSGATAKPAVTYGTWDEIQEVAKSSGRITVVDLWSLSCEPCLKEFPGLVRIHKTMGTSVQCIAVDVDFDGRKSRPPEHYEERVAAFLESVDASGFPTYICKTPNEDVFAAAKLVSIPAVLIYNAEGEVVKIFVDAGEGVGFSYEKDILPIVESLAG